LGPPVFTTQTTSLSIQPFYAWLTIVTNRQTDRPRYTPSVTIGCICIGLRSTVMRPNNNNHNVCGAVIVAQCAPIAKVQSFHSDQANHNQLGL